VIRSPVSARVSPMPLADTVVSVGEATLAFQTVGNVSAVDVRMSATVKLGPASVAVTTLVALTANGVQMASMVTRGQVLAVVAGHACVPEVNEVATNMVIRVAWMAARVR
jgi:hypothetical protein